jgi:hypothetical protein
MSAPTKVKSSAQTEEWARRLERFKTDPRYRIENLFWIKVAKTRETIRLRFNEAQVRLYQEYQWFRDHRMPVRLILCKARRAGLSTGCQALIFDDVIRNPDTQALILAHQASASDMVLGMCTAFWQNLPPTVQFKTPKGIEEYEIRPKLAAKYNNQPSSDKLEFAPPLGSRIYTASAKSIDAYRGGGFQHLHATEAAYYDDGEGLFTALSPLISDDPISMRFIESTPNGQSGKGAWFYEQVMDAKLRGRTQYGETRLVFIPWHEMVRSFSIPFDDMSQRAEFERTLKPEERDVMRQYPHVSLEQMKWRRSKLAEPPFNKDPTIFDQEYPSDEISAFLLSGSSVFNRSSIKRLASRTREPVWVGDVYWGESDRGNERDAVYNTVRRPHFYTKGEAPSYGFASHVTDKTLDNLKVWRWPTKGERIIIGADIGRGNPNTDDGDYSTICVGALNDFGKDELLMTWRGRLNPILFGEVCAALSWGIRYRVGDGVHAPMLAPEWTGPGSATCTYLDQKKLYEVDAYRMPGVKGMPKTKHIGWESNSKTKPYSVNMMVRMVEKDVIDIPSEQLVMEMSSFRQHDPFGDEGSYGGVGGHDDLVSSFMIMCAIMRLETATVPGEARIIEIDQDDPDVMPGGDIYATDPEPFDLLAPQPEAEEDYGYSWEGGGESYGDDQLFAESGLW